MCIGTGIKEDFINRIKWYKDDWKEGINSGFRIFAPATYIFFASAIPALAFGEQISHDTDGILNGVHVLAATALCGFIQAVFGGQPLLIVGVAEPIVLVYMFMYEFLKSNDKNDLFLPWSSWVCIWAAFFIFVLAMSGSCSFIDKFTRFSGELFGMLIALLFMQQAIKGLVEEFKRQDHYDDDDNIIIADLYYWRLVNGIWSLILALGLLYSSLLLHGARSWRFGFGWIRTFLADYGVPLMVFLWTGISYAIKSTPEDIPRRLSIPNVWDEKETWKTAQDLGKVDNWLIAAAAIPGFIITVLFFFDHNVSSQLAQQKEFDLKKPSTYNYDFLLLSLMTLICGLIGIPPVNGVLPQAPMHTKSLATLKKQLIKRDLKRASKNAAESNNGSSIKESRSTNNLNSMVSEDNKSNEGIHKSHSEQELIFKHNLNKQSQNPSNQSKDFIAIEVKEQRLSGMLQSLLVACCLAITPVLQKIPKSVLWGYFAYMAIESLPGSEFWDRIMLLFTDPKKRYMLLEVAHAPYLETVKFSVIVKFTLFQLIYMLIVWGITWAGVVGIAFPIAIMLLVPIRQYLMPLLFSPEHLRELDMADYEEAPPISHKDAIKVSGGILEDRIDERDELDENIIGEMLPQVKHHLSRSEIERRKEEIDYASTVHHEKSKDNSSTLPTNTS